MAAVTSLSDSTLGHSKGISEATYVTDDVIPPSNTCRTVVLCFDGTGDQFNSANSNIVQLFAMLCKDEPDRQVVYYQAGIGTYTIPQIMTPFMAKVAKTVDMMLGSHLDAHVMSGYEFLMENYKAGDKICLFGFSRGAYTARALAGMIHKVGLLPRGNHQQVPFAYKMFSRDDDLGWRQSTAFKIAFSINVHIEYMGVWDTVNSVGFVPRTLPFTRTNNNIRYFRHALSLDEHRVRFQPNFFHKSTEEDNKYGVQPGEMPRSVLRNPQPSASKQSGLFSDSSEPITETDVKEVWFSGGHGDVGGGDVDNGTRNSLARISLRWMIRECFLANTGILFHCSTFKQIGMDWNTLWPHVIERPPAIYQSQLQPLAPQAVANNDPDVVLDTDGGTFVSEEHEDLADALSEHQDQLVVAPLWWILEFLPQKLYSHRDDFKKWYDGFTIHLGAGRKVPGHHKDDTKVHLHRTVKIRMEADGLPAGKYLPKAKVKADPVWAD